jgi:hypothetical protein
MCAHDRNKSSASVSFGSIQVREHERVLGANADTYMGLAIGWDYQQHEPISVLAEQYEQAKGREKMSACQRLSILNRYGFSLHEVMCSEKERRKLQASLLLEEHCLYEKDYQKRKRLPRFLRKWRRKVCYALQ